MNYLLELLANKLRATGTNYRSVEEIEKFYVDVNDSSEYKLDHF